MLICCSASWASLVDVSLSVSLLSLIPESSESAVCVGVWLSLLLLRAGCCCFRSAAGDELTLLSMFSLSERAKFAAIHRAPCALFESEEDMRASLDATLCDS